MIRVEKADVPILVFLWEHDEHMRSPFAISEKLNLSYNYVCGRLGRLSRRGAIKRIRRGKNSYYTKPYKGYMFYVLQHLTGLSMTQCAKRFDKLMSGEE